MTNMKYALILSIAKIATQHSNNCAYLMFLLINTIRFRRVFSLFMGRGPPCPQRMIAMPRSGQALPLKKMLSLTNCFEVKALCMGNYINK